MSLLEWKGSRFTRKRVVFQHQYQWNRGRFFTWSWWTLICPMFYMRVRGPGYYALTKTRYMYMHVSSCNDRVVDSLCMVLENFITPYSEDHQLAVLLTQSFLMSMLCNVLIYVRNCYMWYFNLLILFNVFYFNHVVLSSAMGVQWIK